jgi:hypothetical protein
LQVFWDVTLSFGLEFRITQRNIPEDLHLSTNLLGIIGKDFDEICHLLPSCIRQTQDNIREYAEIIYQLLAVFKKAHDTVTNGILYNIPSGFNAPKKF